MRHRTKLCRRVSFDVPWREVNVSLVRERTDLQTWRTAHNRPNQAGIGGLISSRLYQCASLNDHSSQATNDWWPGCTTVVRGVEHGRSKAFHINVSCNLHRYDGGAMTGWSPLLHFPPQCSGSRQVLLRSRLTRPQRDSIDPANLYRLYRSA